MRLKTEIESRLSPTKVTLKMGGPGSLDVFVDNRKVFSKSEAGRFPTAEEIVALIKT